MQVNANTNHCVARSAVITLNPHSFNEHARQFAWRLWGAHPHIVGPLQTKPKALLRVQSLGHAHPNGQGQPRPIGRRQHQPQRKGEGISALPLPSAALPASAGTLLLGHQKTRAGVAKASTAHEFAVGGVDGWQDLDIGQCGQGLNRCLQCGLRPMQGSIASAHQDLGDSKVPRHAREPQ